MLFTFHLFLLLFLFTWSASESGKSYSSSKQDGHHRLGFHIRIRSEVGEVELEGSYRCVRVSLCVCACVLWVYRDGCSAAAVEEPLPA
uniref:Putative secreted protein n=1 Tax=Anopheles marajoara TaxID=58244 RepID=A0A2M4CAH3_9DIPT